MVECKPPGLITFAENKKSIKRKYKTCKCDIELKKKKLTKKKSGGMIKNVKKCLPFKERKMAIYCAKPVTDQNFQPGTGTSRTSHEQPGFNLKFDSTTTIHPELESLLKKSRGIPVGVEYVDYLLAYFPLGAQEKTPPKGYFNLGKYPYIYSNKWEGVNLIHHQGEFIEKDLHIERREEIFLKVILTDALKKCGPSEEDAKAEVDCDDYDTPLVQPNTVENKSWKNERFKICFDGKKNNMGLATGNYEEIVINSKIYKKVSQMLDIKKKPTMYNKNLSTLIFKPSDIELYKVLTGTDE